MGFFRVWKVGQCWEGQGWTSSDGSYLSSITVSFGVLIFFDPLVQFPSPTTCVGLLHFFSMEVVTTDSFISWSPGS